MYLVHDDTRIKRRNAGNSQGMQAKADQGKARGGTYEQHRCIPSARAASQVQGCQESARTPHISPCSPAAAAAAATTTTTLPPPCCSPISAVYVGRQDQRSKDNLGRALWRPGEGHEHIDHLQKRGTSLSRKQVCMHCLSKQTHVEATCRPPPVSLSSPAPVAAIPAGQAILDCA